MKIIKIELTDKVYENNFAIIDRTITKKAGIYFLFNKDMELIYIGKAKNIRCRLVQHCSDKSIRYGEYEYPAGVTPCDKKEVAYFSCIEIEDESERDLKELILLNIIKTKYNFKDKYIQSSDKGEKSIEV